MPTPPIAAKKPHQVSLHGDTLVDDYYWLRNKQAAEVRAYIEAENAYAATLMKPTEALQATLYKEIVGRIQQSDLSVPVRRGEFYYYARTEEGAQYPLMCRKRGSLEAAEEVLLDLNQLAKGHAFLGLGSYEVSPDGTRLAYSLDTTGFREYTLYIKDLGTGAVSPAVAVKVSSVAWAMDSRTLLYSVDDSAKRPYRVYRHVVGTPSADDPLIYEERDERFQVRVRASRSQEHLFVESHSLTTSEIRYVSATQPTSPLMLMGERVADQQYFVAHHGDLFYIRTNDKGRNFRLVTAPVSKPGREHWTELLPHRDAVMLRSHFVFRDHYVLYELEGGQQHLRITDLDTGKSHRIELPETVYSIDPAENPEFATTTFRYKYQSLVTPPSVYDYDMETKTASLRKQEKVLGGYDPTAYQSERMYAQAADGTRVPISLVYRKGARKPGGNPMLLGGYGSYGTLHSIGFSHARVSLLDRGVIYAIAHVRGGGELGKKWHDNGRMMNKRNTFTDFLAVAVHLMAEGYTARDRLVVEGGSAGGLLMGAVANMRPDLFKAVIARVPFVDVLNTMSDPGLPLTVAEYEEWGNPANPEHYAYMKTYCPYTNIEAKDYPAMLVKTGFNDSQVMYWEPAKYVAKLRARKTDRNPLLFITNMAGGHGGSSGRYDKYKEIALDYAFVLWQVGVEH